MRGLFLLLLLSIIYFDGFAQSAPPTLSYAEFEEILEVEDTLIVANFWATWCKPCVKELPYFEELHQEFQGKKAKIILVSLDFESMIDSKLVPFLIENDIRSEVIVLSEPDANSWIDKIHHTWSGAIPATLFIKDGQKHFYEGDVSSVEELKAKMPFDLQ